VTVHATSCKSILGLDPERFIEVAWDAGGSAEQTHEIAFKVWIRPTKGALSTIVAALADEVTDVVEAQAAEAKSGLLAFRVAVKDYAQYEAAVKALAGLGGLVERVERYYPEDSPEGEDEPLE
jgi:(p)ppGpp synthase/HD superfamily hydrolase